MNSKSKRKRKTVPVGDYDKLRHELTALELSYSNLNTAKKEQVIKMHNDCIGASKEALDKALAEVRAFNSLPWWSKLLMFNKTFHV